MKSSKPPIEFPEYKYSYIEYGSDKPFGKPCYNCCFKGVTGCWNMNQEEMIKITGRDCKDGKGYYYREYWLD